MAELFSYTISADLPPFEYIRLPTISSFRYLELLSGVGDNEVEVRLHLAEWDNPPVYEAISYAWGDPKDNVSLSLGTGAIEIPGNLVDGLKSMRSAETSRFLWADAICIDQGNVKERNHQVDNMRRIYQSAKQVVVWLGQDTKGSSAIAFEAFEETAQACPTHNPLRDVVNLSDVVPSTCSPKLESYLRDRMDEIVELLLLSWFKRLWVLQEVNATLEVQVQWGISLVSWHVLALAMSFFLKHSSRFGKINLLAGTISNIHYMRFCRWRETEPILHALHYGRGFRCSDPRDHVYALLGMPAIYGVHNIMADYAKSPLDLFQDIARLAIEWSYTLSILSYVQHEPDDLETFPSWIPKWHEGWLGSPLIHFHHDFNADRGEALQHLLNEQDYQLSVRGVCSDTVAEREYFDHWRHYSGSSYEDLQAFMQRLLNHPFSEFLRLDQLREQGDIMCNKSLLNLGKILCCGRIHLREVNDDHEAYIIAYMRHHMEGASSAEYANPTADIQEYASTVRMYMSDRCLFNTEKGYSGCGRSLLQPGDKLCVLYGGYVPYILRPDNRYYKLIGEAYIPEFMHSRAMDMLDAGQLEKKVFVLK